MASTSTESSLRKRAVQGAAWTIGAYGISQILRFGSNLVLTRLLVPELFGLISLVYVFITGLHLFSDLGIGPSIIQNQRGDEPKFLNTAWTLQIVRGGILWLCCLVIAYPVSLFYHEPKLFWLIPIVGLNTLISGFNSTALATLNRHLSLRTLALYELSGQVVSLIVMLIWAWLSPSIWAIVAGGFVGSVYGLALSHWFNRRTPNRFTWDPTALKEIISFGKWVFLSTALFFLASQSDRLILGKLFSLQLLGVYGIAFTLADVPRQIFSALASKVFFPAYSKMVELPRPEFRAKILRSRHRILLVMSPLMALLVGTGDLIIRFLYDERYAAAAWMFPMLAMGVWPLILVQSIDQSLWALGKPNYSTVASFFSFLCYVIGIPLGYYSPFKEVGAVLAVAVSNIPIWFVIIYGLWREKLLAIRQDLLMTALFLTFLGVVITCRLLFLGNLSFG